MELMNLFGKFIQQFNCVSINRVMCPITLENSVANVEKKNMTKFREASCHITFCAVTNMTRSLVLFLTGEWNNRD